MLNMLTGNLRPPCNLYMCIRSLEKTYNFSDLQHFYINATEFDIHVQEQFFSV